MFIFVIKVKLITLTKRELFLILKILILKIIWPAQSTCWLFWSPYKETFIFLKTFPDGNIQYKIALITDQDKCSKDNEKNNTWKSFLLTGNLYFNPQSLNTTVIWNNQSKVLYSQLNFDGKAMEYVNFLK